MANSAKSSILTNKSGGSAGYKVYGEEKGIQGKAECGNEGNVREVVPLRPRASAVSAMLSSQDRRR